MLKKNVDRCTAFQHKCPIFASPSLRAADMTSPHGRKEALAEATPLLHAAMRHHHVAKKADLKEALLNALMPGPLLRLLKQAQMRLHQLLPLFGVQRRPRKGNVLFGDPFLTQMLADAALPLRFALPKQPQQIMEHVLLSA